MKLLGWMHRKFRQNSGMDQFKEFSVGRPSLQEAPPPSQHLPKRPSRSHFPGFFPSLEDVQVDVGHFEDEEILQGLLAIGTLGSDPPLSSDHHRNSVETITEKDTDVTLDDIKLFNDELEKVLGMDVKDVVLNKDELTTDLASGRNSHVILDVSSAKPSSVAPENVASICPLQGYLFGSPIELPETKAATTGAGAKEHRTSLAELFQRTKAEESGGVKGGKWEREEKREAGERSGVQLLKKMLKRRLNSGSAKGGCDSVSLETKLNRILHIFHRKVHPEINAPAVESKSAKPDFVELKSSNARNEGSEGDIGGSAACDQMNDTILVFPETVRAIGKAEGFRPHKCRPNPGPFALAGSDSNGNREYWIKTDADYLVLEL